MKKRHERYVKVSDEYKLGFKNPLIHAFDHFI